MDDCSPLDCFNREWACYLEHHGHRVKQISKSPAILASRNGKRQAYRWLLWCVDSDSVLLKESQIRMIRAQARLAKKARQQCFVVVKFGHPGGNAIAVPASRAIRAKLLSCEKGAIPWEQ